MGQTKSIIVAASALLLSGCASMTFYNKPEMSEASKEGLKFYYAKPYLLVARDGTAKVTSITVQYLPDLANPAYAKAKAGYGSSNLTLAFANGIITNFGQQVDTKVPETVSSLASLIPGYGNAVKALTDASIEKKKADVAQQASDLPKDAQQLMAVATSLRALAGQKTFTGILPAAIIAAADELYVAAAGATPAKGLAVRLNTPGAAAEVDAISKELKGVIAKLKAIKTPEGVVGAAAIDWAKFNQLVAQASDVLADLTPKADAQDAPPVLTLYEIVMTSAGTSLKEVPLPKSATP